MNPLRTTSSRVASLLLGWLPLLSLAAGCGADEGAASCPAHTTCDEPPSGSLGFGAELILPTSSGQVREELGVVAFNQRGEATLSAATPVLLSGRVQRGKDTPLPAEITATRPSLISGRPDLFFHASTDSAGAYVLSLPPGGYQVRVAPRAPADGVVPPLVLPLELTSALEQSFSLPEPGELPWVVGRVVDALDTGLVGAEVRAIDPATGALRSALATVPAKSGDFVLYLGRDVRPADELLVAATPAQPDLPVLSIKVVVGAGVPIKLRLPPLPHSLHFTVPVRGRSTSGAILPVVGARVEFETDASGSVKDIGQIARFAVTSLTADDGAASVSLIPGLEEGRAYQVTVTPPADSPFGRKRFTVSVGAVGGVLKALLLDVRPRLVGRLLDPDGRPVKDAVVAPMPEGGGSGATTLPSTTTDVRGGFALNLDADIYDVQLVPPPAAPLARWSFRRTISADVDAGSIHLPRATMNRLTVLDPAGNPLPGVEVRLFAISYATGCVGDQRACALPARLRGDGTTDSRGQVSLLLPAP